MFLICLSLYTCIKKFARKKYRQKNRKECREKRTRESFKVKEFMSESVKGKEGQRENKGDNNQKNQIREGHSHL